MRGSASWSVVNLPQKHLVPTFDSWQRDKLKGCKTFQQWPKKPLQSLSKRYSMRMYSSCFIHYLVFKMTKFGVGTCDLATMCGYHCKDLATISPLNSKLVKGRNSGAWRMPHWCKALGGSGQYLKMQWAVYRMHIIYHHISKLYIYPYDCTIVYVQKHAHLSLRFRWDVFSEFNWNTNLIWHVKYPVNMLCTYKHLSTVNRKP